MTVLHNVCVKTPGKAGQEEQDRAPGIQAGPDLLSAGICSVLSSSGSLRCGQGSEEVGRAGRQTSMAGALGM